MSCLFHRKPKLSIKIESNETNEAHNSGRLIGCLPLKSIKTGRRIPIFTPGDWLRGTLNLQLYSPLYHDDELNAGAKIILFLQGFLIVWDKINGKRKEKYHHPLFTDQATSTQIQLWPPTSTADNSAYEEINNLIEMRSISGSEAQLIGNIQQEGEGLTELASGNHNFAFRLRLPDECPPSFEAKGVTLHFHCIAELYGKTSSSIWSFKNDYGKLRIISRCIRRFYVRQHIDFSPFTHPQTLKIQMFTDSDALSEQIPLSIWLEKSCFTPGEQISIKIESAYKNGRNLIRRKGRFQGEVEITRKIYVVDTFFIPNTKNLPIKIYKNDNSLMDGWNIDFPLLLPVLSSSESFVPTYNSKLVEVAYELHVKLKFQRAWPIKTCYIYNGNISIKVAAEKWSWSNLRFHLNAPI